jgi:prevent-host-death family protein
MRTLKKYTSREISMHTVTAREARSGFSELLNETEHGSTIAIFRRGHEVARLVPPPKKKAIKFPDLSQFRKSITVIGVPSSQVVVDMREEERF